MDLQGHKNGFQGQKTSQIHGLKGHTSPQLDLQRHKSLQYLVYEDFPQDWVLKKTKSGIKRTYSAVKSLDTPSGESVSKL